MGTGARVTIISKNASSTSKLSNRMSTAKSHRMVTKQDFNNKSDSQLQLEIEGYDPEELVCDIDGYQLYKRFKFPQALVKKYIWLLD